VHQSLAAVPAPSEAQTDLFITYWKLGRFQQEQRRYAQAVAWFRKGLEVLRPLHAAGKLHGQFKDAVANEEKNLAACELLAKVAPALLDESAWPLLWGWPRF
jgi:hypothetical protein